MLDRPDRSPMVPLARVALLAALGDLVTKQLAVLWIDALEPHVSSAIRFGVVHNDKGAFGLSLGDYTFHVSLALTLATVVLIVPVARDLARIDRHAPAALGLIAGGALGNLVSLLMSPKGVVDFIALQRADGAGIVLNVADVAAYAGVMMLMRTGAIVMSEIRRRRSPDASMVAAQAMTRDALLARLGDVEVARPIAREPETRRDGEIAPARVPSGDERSVLDRSMHLRVIQADLSPERPGRALAARLRRAQGGAPPQSASQYLRPMSHTASHRPHLR